MICGEADVMTIEIKYTINVMYLNHPQTIPLTPVHGNTVFHETSPWCQKGWGPLPKALYDPAGRQGRDTSVTSAPVE